MKKTLLTLTLALAFIGAQAQCTPDPQYTAVGIYPDSLTGLSPATVGIAYNQNITIIVPSDTSVVLIPGSPAVNVTIDKIDLTSVTGLPSSFSYSCDPPSCSFPGGTIKCAALSSVAPTSSEVGLHQIIFETTTYVSGVPLIGTTTQNDVLDYYYLEIFGTTTPTWNCSNGVCSDPGTGNGTYASLSDCQANCVVLTPTWNCNNGVCSDPGTGTGAYTSLTACQTVCGTTEVKEQTTNKELLKVTDLLGRETKATNQPLFYIYNDGTVEKKVVIE